jgi:chromosomal replication initiation ATPase DnaA
MRNEHAIRQKIQSLKNAFTSTLNQFTDELEAISESLGAPAESYTKEQIRKAVCDHFKITSTQLSKKKVKGPIRQAREIQCLLLYTHFTPNKTEISRIMGYGSDNGCIRMLRNAQDNADSNLSYSRIFNTNLNAVRALLQKKK